MIDNNIPVWDLSQFYEDFTDSAYIASFSRLKSGIENLDAELSLCTAEAQDFDIKLENLVRLFNETLSLYEELYSYAYCRYSTDTSSGIAQKELGKLDELSAKFNTFRAAFRNMIAESGSRIPEIIEGSAYLKDFRFFFDEELEFQKYQMPVELEDLASALAVSGAESWTKLQNTLTSSASALWNGEGGEKKTLTELRALAFSPDEKVRRRAWETEIELCRSIEVPVAFALNGVKGYCNTVNSRRNYENTLEKSRRQARISSETLSALISVLEESLPLFRKYMTLKAGLLGKNKLAFYDLFAPVGVTENDWSYTKAADFIIRQFSEFSRELGDFAAQAVRNNWIDALPRKNKVGGAYCTGFHVSGTSRILCNFNNSFSSLTTIAHELGHAYHNFILKDAPEIYRDFPMTLAETASIFCETIVLEGALTETPEDRRLALVEHELMESTQVIVDILSRFIFEKDIFDKRLEGELSAEEYCSSMLSAQRQTYGDAMDGDYMHPYMWLVKGHYYHQDLGYYNFPYAFGKLFGLGLYSKYREEGPSFTDKYRDLLYMTGSAGAEDVTMSAGCDIRKQDFWRSSIGLISDKINEFERLCKSR